MSLLELPQDILKVISSFMTRVADFMIFESTCKQIRSISFSIERELCIGYLPIEATTWLKRDLRHLRKLSFVIRQRDGYDWMLDKLTVLTTCHNLTSLNCLVDPFSDDSFRGEEFLYKYPGLRKIYQKMTWLESLRANFPYEERFGELFKDHNKLTKLRIHCLADSTDFSEAPEFWMGFDKLTQVRSINFPMHAGDHSFTELVQMENLQELDLRESNILEASGITRLTNLEKLKRGSNCIDRDVLNWKILKKLPKLQEFRDDLEGIEDNDFDDLRQATQFTRLYLFNDHYLKKISPEKLRSLENLQSLRIDFECSSADFSLFRHLTHLRLWSINENVPEIRLPPTLKSFAIEYLQDTYMDSICSTLSLERLEINNVNDNLPAEIAKISRLSNLKFLHLGFMKDEMNLAPLPALRELSLSSVSDTDIDSLKHVTQLCQLTVQYIISPLTMLEIRQQLPFIVYRYCPGEKNSK